jgi:plasmid stability protein
MSTTVLTVRLNARLKKQIRARAKGQHRPLSEQVRRYLEIAMMVEENPDLPFQFIADALESKAEAEAGMLEPLDWSVK